jgi:hypothetical protein
VVALLDFGRSPVGGALRTFGKVKVYVPARASPASAILTYTTPAT